MQEIIRHKTPAGLPKIGPKDRGDAAVGKLCIACDELIRVGEHTTQIALGPGKNEAARAQARKGEWYSAVAVEVHYACATGEET